ncbi:MAG: hypothetical protein ACPG63_06245 [Luminiphilus sp.]
MRALLTLEPINEKPLAAIPDGELVGVADNVNVSRRGIGNVVEPGTVINRTRNLQTRPLRTCWSLRALKSLRAIGTRSARIALKALRASGPLSTLRAG